MMRDDVPLDDLGDDELGEHVQRPVYRAGPFADREVPIGRAPVAIADAVHAWLDGEGTEDSARRLGSAEDVEFWKRLDAVLRSGRRLSAPTHLRFRVLDAIRDLEA